MTVTISPVSGSRYEAHSALGSSIAMTMSWRDTLAGMFGGPSRAVPLLLRPPRASAPRRQRLLVLKLSRIEAASLHVVFVEHAFRYGIGRAVIVPRVVLIELDGDHNTSADIGASPFPTGGVELQPDSEIVSCHVSSHCAWRGIGVVEEMNCSMQARPSRSRGTRGWRGARDRGAWVSTARRAGSLSRRRPRISQPESYA